MKRRTLFRLFAALLGVGLLPGAAHARQDDTSTRLADGWVLRGDDR